MLPKRNTRQNFRLFLDKFVLFIVFFRLDPKTTGTRVYFYNKYELNPVVGSRIFFINSPHNMAISHQQKVDILEKLQNDVATQKSILLLTTNNAEQSLDSELTFKLRKSGRDVGIQIKVVKNTLIQKAFESVPALVGPTYLAYMVNKEDSDEITVAKSIVNTIKADFKTNVNILGAIVNGEFLDASRTITLSNTPSKLDSLSSIAGMLNSFAAKIATGIKEVPSSVARGVSQYSKTLS
jgi:large subunit ribosomal protein L10